MQCEKGIENENAAKSEEIPSAGQGAGKTRPETEIQAQCFGLSVEPVKSAFDDDCDDHRLFLHVPVRYSALSDVSDLRTDAVQLF